MSIFSRLRKTQAKTASKQDDATNMKKAATAPKSAGAVDMNQRILVRPLVTEKGTVNGTYQFEVPLSANKTEVSKAIERLYGVAPSHVRMMRVSGKTVRSTFRAGKRKDWKKAVVRLPVGKTINVYEGV